MDEQCVPTHTATQVAYHLRVATACAVSGDPTRAASEIALAWTLLADHGWIDASGAHDLPIPHPGLDVDWDALARRTEALALEVQSHFVSEGQHSIASMYEDAAGNVRRTIATLRG